MESLAEKPQSIVSDAKSGFDPSKEFLFRGDRLRLFSHPINETADNERTVEVPIGALELERARKGCKILEVGDVLWQYGFETPRTIVDLGSEREGVIKKDALDISGTFDLILGLSSFEHIGVDILQGDVFRCVHTVSYLCNRLSVKGGKILLTVPVGYNKVLDEWLQYMWKGKIRFLVRTTRSGQWAESDRVMMRNIRYGYPFPAGNAIIVAEWQL